MTKKILVSPGFGSGWSTWADEDMRIRCLTDEALIRAVEAKNETWIRAAVVNIVKDAEKKESYVHIGSNIDQLEIIEVDRPFRVNEYDGSESVEFQNESSFINPRDL